MEYIARLKLGQEVYLRVHETVVKDSIDEIKFIQPLVKYLINVDYQVRYHLKNTNKWMTDLDLYEEEGDIKEEPQIETIVKRQAALRLLRTYDCYVKLENDDNIYHTRHRDFIDDVIYIEEQQMYQDYTYITHIGFKNSFGLDTFAKVVW